MIFCLFLFFSLLILSFFPPLSLTLTLSGCASVFWFASRFTLHTSELWYVRCVYDRMPSLYCVYGICCCCLVWLPLSSSFRFIQLLFASIYSFQTMAMIFEQRCCGQFYFCCFRSFVLRHTVE